MAHLVVASPYSGIALVIFEWHLCRTEQRIETPENSLASIVKQMRALDDGSAQPLYQQLQRSLREAIENRLIAPDDALPPERDLADELQVSRITVRKAI